MVLSIIFRLTAKGDIVNGVIYTLAAFVTAIALIIHNPHATPKILLALFLGVASIMVYGAIYTYDFDKMN